MPKEFEIGGPIAYYPYRAWTQLCDCQGGSLSIPCRPSSRFLSDDSAIA